MGHPKKRREIPRRAGGMARILGAALLGMTALRFRRGAEVRSLRWGSGPSHPSHRTRRMGHPKKRREIPRRAGGMARILRAALLGMTALRFRRGAEVRSLRWGSGPSHPSHRTRRMGHPKKQKQERRKAG